MSVSTPSVTTDTGRFSIVPHWLLDALMDQPRSGASAIAVYVALGVWADRETNDCWPSHRSIAEKVGLGQTAVKNALTRLREVGAVSWTQTVTPQGDPGPNVYRLHRTRPTPVAETTHPVGLDYDPGSVAEAATNERQLNESQMELEVIAPGGSLSTTASTAADLDAEFTAFWEMYGKTGPRKKARECWERAIKKDPPSVILDGLERWVEYWRTPGAASVKWPQGWLNEERWRDDPPTGTVRLSQPSTATTRSRDVLERLASGELT